MKKQVEEQSSGETKGSSEASLTKPVQCSSIKKGGYAMIRGHPCKVVDVSVSKTGKHGHAKALLVGVDIFTGKKYEEICPTTHNMQVPIVTKSDLLLVDITQEGFLSLLLPDGRMKYDLKLPDDLKKHLTEIWDSAQEDLKDVYVSVLSGMGTELPISAKLVH